MCQRVRCNNCYWEGEEDELETFSDPIPDNPDTEEYYKGCPTCKTDDYLIDIEQNMCAICDKPIANNKIFCSEQCAKVDLNDTKDES